MSSLWTPDRLADLSRSVGVEVDDSPETLDSIRSDFGRYVEGSAAGVVRPRSTDQVQAIVSFANDRGLGLTPRGLGHTAGGQAVPSESLSLDFSAMASVDEVADDRVTCGPGALVRDVVTATLARDRIPPVLPLNPDLTVGGLIATGGIGGGSHRSGTLAGNILELEVVTGDGRVVRCSPDGEPDVFRAVRGGLGRYGVITRAVLELRPAPPRIRTFYLLYDDVERWIEDQRRIADDGRSDVMEGFCTVAVQGLHNTPGGRRPLGHWFYGLHVSFEFDDDPPDEKAALDGLAPYRVVHVEDDDTSKFQDRYGPRFEMMRRSGGWEQRHPFFSCFLPMDAVPEVLSDVLPMIPLFLGDGHRLFVIAEHGDPSFVVTPPDAAAFAVLPAGVPEPFAQDAIAALAAVEDRMLAAGGKRYLEGWLGTMTDRRWEHHFGDLYQDWTALKERFDPAGVLRSALFPERAR